MRTWSSLGSSVLVMITKSRKKSFEGVGYLSSRGSGKAAKEEWIRYRRS
jgi:hypothetical protein